MIGTETLELRRLKADPMYIHNILFYLLDLEPATLIEPATLYIKLTGGTSTRLGTLCHTFYVQEIQDIINACRFYFKSQSSSDTECLLENATNVKTLHVFKEFIHNIDISSQQTINSLTALITIIIINVNKEITYVYTHAPPPHMYVISFSL